jgi:diguanylate cyclase (GGDEF)-like protein
VIINRKSTSYHDQLTGLYNRRFYEEELNRFDTYRNLPMSFIFGDINGLKIINDAFGHESGDQLIIEVANVLNSECRSDDVVSRIGGDEFVILLPNTKLVDAEVLVIRIQSKLEQKKIMDIGISVSFGCSVKSHNDELTLDILKKAEDKMYQNKIREKASNRSTIINSIINILYVKSPIERTQSKRVGFICETIGTVMHINEDDIRELKIAGELHDIGNIAVDDSVLSKSGPLSQSEWLQIQKHPETGFRLLSTYAEYHNIATYVHAHHERWDGTGYPMGIKGNEIPLKARILFLASAYIAMISDSLYKEALTPEQAIVEINKYSGTQFDPTVVKIFIEEVLQSDGEIMTF